MESYQFKKEDYGLIFSNIINPDQLNDLGSGEANNSLKNEIDSIKINEAFEPGKISDHDYASACLSAIWLHHDFLDESHTISQSIYTNTGSFWHGIMHRREGDYWNSKYWFRQVGNHPVFSNLNLTIDQLFNSAESSLRKKNESSEIDTVKNLLTHNSWDPFIFVDMVQKYNGTDTKIEEILKEVQRLEWQFLFDYCFNKAIGSVMP